MLTEDEVVARQWLITLTRNIRWAGAGSGMFPGNLQRHTALMSQPTHVPRDTVQNVY